MPGSVSSDAKVARSTARGFWLRLGEEELFVSFADFPWFKGATREQLTTLELPAPDHLRWPLLDVDLSVESIREPGRFPLVANLD
jgi:hypothetical protein